MEQNVRAGFLLTKSFKLSVIAVSLVALVILSVYGGGYYMRLVTLAAIGVILSLGLNVCYGMCGQINFGVAAFYAVGAYGSTLLQTRLGMHFLFSLPLIVVAGFILAFAMAIPLLRLRGHTLALGTIALSLVVWTALEYFQPITGGGDGLGVPRVSILGHRMGRAFFLWFTIAAAGISFVVCRNIASSRIGRAMSAVRVNENAASVLGIDVAFYKHLAFAINGAFAALAGGMLAQTAGWIGTGYFDLWTNVLVLIMVCFGGLGNNFGAVVGGALIMLLPEALAVFKSYRGLAYGAILVLSLVFMPSGVAGLVKSLMQPRRDKRPSVAVNART